MTVCSRIKKKQQCKKIARYGINWSKICAKTCGNEELCPAREDHPSELLRGEFHFLVALQ